MLHLSEDKEIHEKMTEKNNGLSSKQEVSYAEDFKKADEAADQAQEDKKKKTDK